MFDVAVVGGGPTGCYAASLLGQRGLDVHVLEEHPVIGEPVNCSGVIGAEAFATLGLPNSLKLGEISCLTLVSPSKLEVNFSPQSPLAYIVDRAAFDRVIAEKTSTSGVTIHLGAAVVDLEVMNGCVELDVKENVNSQENIEVRNLKFGNGHRKIKAGMVILAGGPHYKLQRKLGMGEPRHFLRTAQAEVEVQGIKETKVLMGSQIAPGSFGWIVPFRRGCGDFARIGVSSKISALPYLKALFEELRLQGHLRSSHSPIKSWRIPISPLQRTFAERVLAVGDAAGQTKPTTGGGIFYGLLCAESIAQTAAVAFEKGDFSSNALRTYEKKWWKRLGKEIRIGTFFRRLAERLTDKEIDGLFRVALSDGILRAITHKARFDWHKDVIYFALRHPALGQIFLRGLFRK